MSAEAPTLEKGQTVDGKYDIVRILGQGGMGAVYEAVHRGTKRRVAVKVILSDALAKDEGVLARFQREARASGSIDSAHVVQVLDTGIEPTTGNPYMVMEYLSGEDVHDLVKRLGPLEPSLAIRIVAQACLGLQRAHDAGIVHRDIKSANMYLARRDAGEMTLKLLDFGIAKVRADSFAASDDQHLTRTGSLLGSPLFMSPEQARGMKEIDGRADLWSLGVVLYQTLTGRTPNEDKETLGDLIIAICTEDPPSVQQLAPWVSPEITAVVERALARNPKHRYANAKEMHDALVALSPGGIGLREDMLVGLPHAMRSEIASVQTGPRGLLLSAPTVLTPNPSSQGALSYDPLASPHAHTTADHANISSRPGAMGGQAITGASYQATGGTGAGTVPRDSKRALSVMLVVAACAVLGGGVGVYLYSHSSKPTANGAALVPPTTSSAVASAQPEPATPSSASTSSPLKVVNVTITAPVGALAELDGSPVTLRGNILEITGAPGSQHKLRLSLGEAADETAVTILESGVALPSKFELVVKPTAKGSGAAHAAAGTGTTSAPAPVKPKPTTTATPAADPTVKREF